LNRTKILIAATAVACLSAGVTLAGGVASAGTRSAAATPGPAAKAAPVMRLSSLNGPVTSSEIASYIGTLTPAANNIGNQWAQGASGQDTQSMGEVYQISGNRAVLDRMIGFCDKDLSERDDLAPAPVGQHVLWTGKVGPAWPNEVVTKPISTGGEQGDSVGHLANCARLILQTPSIWHQRVTIGDPHGYGATYLQRARTFVEQSDFTMDKQILGRLLNVSNGNRQYFAADSPYKGGQAVPWNQQMMFDYAFQNLAIDHQILGDSPQREKQYDGLVQTSVNWFFSQAHTYTDHAGRKAYSWDYAAGTGDVEDNDHGSLDVAGLYQAYLSGRYRITAAMMTPLANTFVDVMTKGPHSYAGRVDGTNGSGNSAPTDYVRSGWLLMSRFQPGAYPAMMSADFPGGTTTADDRFASALMLQYWRTKK